MLPYHPALAGDTPSPESNAPPDVLVMAPRCAITQLCIRTQGQVFTSSVALIIKTTSPPLRIYS